MTIVFVKNFLISALLTEETLSRIIKECNIFKKKWYEFLLFLWI